MLESILDKFGKLAQHTKPMAELVIITMRSKRIENPKILRHINAVELHNKEILTARYIIQFKVGLVC